MPKGGQKSVAKTAQLYETCKNPPLPHATSGFLPQFEAKGTSMQFSARNRTGNWLKRALSGADASVRPRSAPRKAVPGEDAMPSPNNVTTTEHDLLARIAQLEAQARDKDEALAEMERARATAEAASAAKSRYLASVSHEIRSPLNSIYGYAQLLERGHHIAPAEAARIIRRSAEHLTNLVEGLLDISHVESGVLRISNDTVRIAPSSIRSPTCSARRLPHAGSSSSMIARAICPNSCAPIKSACARS
jgi:signal transduction histidine kinase